LSYQKSPFELKLWEKTKSEDLRERAEAFGKLAEFTHSHDDFATSLTCAKQSTMLYEELNDSFGQAEGHYFEGRALRGQNDNSGALAKFEKAAEFFRANPNEFYLAAILCEQGHAYLELEQHVLAKNAFENGMNLFTVEEKWSDAGFAALMSAEMLFQLKDYAQAEFNATRALDLLAKDEDEGSYLFTARSYKVRGDAHVEQHDYEAACADYWQAFYLLEYLNIEIYKIEVLLDLSKALIWSRSFEEAKPLISQAREIGKTASLIRAQAHADLLEAQIFAQEGDEAEAKKLLTRARTVFVSSPDKNLMFQCDFELGRVLQRSDHMLAAAQFEYALQQAELSKYELEDHVIYLELARAYLEFGRADAVVSRAHLVDLKKLPTPDWVAAATNYHARALVLIGQAQQALDELPFLLDETNSDLDPTHRAYALETKARALLNLGEAQAALEILTPLLLQYSLDQQTELVHKIAALMQDCNLKISQDAASILAEQATEIPTDQQGEPAGE